MKIKLNLNRVETVSQIYSSLHCEMKFQPCFTMGHIMAWKHQVLSERFRPECSYVCLRMRHEIRRSRRRRGLFPVLLAALNSLQFSSSGWDHFIGGLLNFF